MEKYIILEGTKNKIADELAELIGLNTEIKKSVEFLEYVSCFVDFLDVHYDILLEREDFEKDNPRDDQTVRGVVSADASYYISIKRTTYILISAIINILLASNPPMKAIADEIKKTFPDTDLALFRKLDQINGESCIILEARRNGKKGIDANYYTRFNGECVNNHLPCRFREDEKCLCSKSRMKELGDILDMLDQEKILRKKDGKYYYTDIF